MAAPVQPSKAAFLKVPTVAGACAVLLGAVVMLGWASGVDLLKGGLSAGITMKFNAAACTFAMGASLLLRSVPGAGRGLRGVSAALAAFVLLVGLVTLSQHVFGWNAGIDELFVSEARGERATASPGRMGPPASTSFVLLGAAVLLLARGERMVVVAQGCGLAVCVIAMLSIVGYAYDADRLFGIARYTGIAAPTALILFILGVGAVALRSDRGPAAVVMGDDAGGLLARRLVPVVLLLPIVFGWVRLQLEARLYSDTRFGTSLLVVALILLLLAVVWHTAAKLGARDRQSRELARQLALSNAELWQERQNLEATVQARTEELATSLERLRRTEHAAAIGTLTAGLGHDVSNLLLPIRSRVDVLRSEDLPESARADVEAIGAAAGYLQRLASGLRLLARDPGDPGRTGETVDLREWWTETQQLLHAALPRGVALQHDIPEDLPAGAISGHQLTQVVFNLVQNAGDVLVARGFGVVRVTAQRLGEPGDGERTLRISVSDDGPGMTEEVRRRCFEPYFSTKRRAFATGMGLPLVRSILERCGGTIEVQSGHGEGTTFLIDLPAAPLVTGEALLAGAMDGGVNEPGAGVGSGCRALVTLLDERRRAFVAYLLGSMGVEIVSPAGRGGAEATSVPEFPDVDVLVTEAGEGAVDRVRRFLRGGSGRGCVVWLGGALEEQGFGPPRVLIAGVDPGAGLLRSVLERAVHMVSPSCDESWAPEAEVSGPTGPVYPAAAD